MGTTLHLSHHPAQADAATDLAVRLQAAGFALTRHPDQADRLLLLLSQQWMDEIWPDLAPAFALSAQRARLLPILVQPCALPPWLARMRPVSLIPGADLPQAVAQIRARLAAQDAPHFQPIWQAGGDDPDRVRTLSAHADFVTDVALFDQGRHAVSASADGSLIVWNLAPTPAIGQPIAALTGHSGAVRAVVATDGLIFSAGADGTLRRWVPSPVAADQASQWTNDRTWDFPATAHTLLATADGNFLVAAGQDAGLTVLDLAQNRLIFHDHIHTDWVRAVALLPPGQAVSAGDDRVLALWDVSTGAILYRWVEAGGQSGGFISALAALPPGPDGSPRVLAGSDDRTLAIWDLATGRAVATLTGHAASVRAVAVWADGRRALSAGNNGTLHTWDLADPARTGPTATLVGHSGAVARVHIQPDGGHALSASTDTTLRLWNLALTTLAQPPLDPGHDGEITALALSPDGGLLASAGEDCTVRLWDAATGRARGQIDSQFPVLALVFVPDAMGDGERLLTANEGGHLALHTLPPLPADPPLAEWQGRGALLCAAVAPGGRWVAAGSVNWAVVLWDTQRGDHRVLSGHRAGVTAVAFLADGRLVSGDETGVLRLWEAGGEEAGRWQVGDEAITAIAPVSEQPWAVIGGEGPTPRLVDLESGAILAEYVGHTDWIFGLGIGDGGKVLITGADDATLRLWDMVSGVEIGREDLPRPLAALVVDPTDSLIYCGDIGGRLLCFQLKIERG